MAAGNVGEVRRHGAARNGPANPVAHHAGTAQEQVMTELCLGRWRGRCRFELIVKPRIEVGSSLGNDERSHMGVLRTAELGALTTIDARPVRLEIELVLMAWNEIQFSRKG